MPNPKHKHSRARRDKRRTQKLRVTPPGMSVCPQCHELKLPHYTCLNCGTYKGKAVIQVEEVYGLDVKAAAVVLPLSMERRCSQGCRG